MIDYDATDTDIQIMQNELLEYGITKKMFDLSRYAGATYKELRNLCREAIAWKQQKDEKAGVLK